MFKARYPKTHWVNRAGVYVFGLLIYRGFLKLKMGEVLLRSSEDASRCSSFKSNLMRRSMVEFTASDSHGLGIGDIITIKDIAYRIEGINGNVITAIFDNFIEDWFREAVRKAIERR